MKEPLAQVATLEAMKEPRRAVLSGSDGGDGRAVRAGSDDGGAGDRRGWEAQAPRRFKQLLQDADTIDIEALKELLRSEALSLSR
eukprot:scaffold117703_cov39-Phaeocystis_antarctica.AAC.1